VSALPEWLAEWWRSYDTGISSETIACVLGGSAALLQTARRLDAPYDGADVGRCVRLLDLAADNGQNWRARIAEVAEVVPAWAPLAPRWAEIEAAYHEDFAAQAAWKQSLYVSDKGRRLTLARKDIPMPPSRSWWLLRTLRDRRDPYADVTPHPFRGGAGVAPTARDAVRAADLALGAHK
jgi:hypothetical protein